ncbi:MAG: DUF2059 domain-containing protein [Oligoflexus sp.]
MKQTILSGIGGIIIGFALSYFLLAAHSSDNPAISANMKVENEQQSMAKETMPIESAVEQRVFQESIATLSQENENLRAELEKAHRTLQEGSQTSDRRIITPHEDTKTMRESIASEYFEVSMQREMIESSFTSVFDNLIQQSEDPELTKGILEITQKYFSWEQLESSYYDLYTETYSAQELSDIVAFYRSPAGRIYAEKQGELVVKSTIATQDIMRRNQEEFTKDIQELMARRMKAKENEASH